MPDHDFTWTIMLAAFGIAVGLSSGLLLSHWRFVVLAAPSM
jgi:hypothetical protein